MDGLKSFFPIRYSLFTYCFIVAMKIWNSVFDKNDKNKHPCLADRNWNMSSFPILVRYWLQGFYIKASSILKYVFLHLNYWIFLSQKDFESYKVFFLHLLRWSCDCVVLCSDDKVHYTYWFYTLKHPCASENNSIWLWCMMSYTLLNFLLVFYFLKKSFSIQHRCCPVVSLLLYYSLVLTPVIMTSSSYNNVIKGHDLIKWLSFRRSLLLFYYYVGIWLDFFCSRPSSIAIFFDKILLNYC